jgi:hypothetical protein
MPHSILDFDCPDSRTVRGKHESAMGIGYACLIRLILAGWTEYVYITVCQRGLVVVLHLNTFPFVKFIDHNSMAKCGYIQTQK